MSEQQRQHCINLTILEILIALIPLVLYIIIFSHLPDKIAVHYGANNIPNRWAPKLSIDVIFICVLGFLGVAFGKLLNWFCVSLNKDQPNIDVVRKIMQITELFLTLLFTLISIYSLSVMMGKTNLSSDFILRVSFAGLSIVWIAIGNYMPKLQKNYISGIRTLSALKDEKSWFKVQRFGGRAMIVFGILSLIISFCAFITSMIANCAIITLFVLMLITICIYSGIQGRKAIK